jgi:hypothetical protein
MVALPIVSAPAFSFPFGATSPDPAAALLADVLVAAAAPAGPNIVGVMSAWRERALMAASDSGEDGTSITSALFLCDLDDLLRDGLCDALPAAPLLAAPAFFPGVPLSSSELAMGGASTDSGSWTGPRRNACTNGDTPVPAALKPAARLLSWTMAICRMQVAVVELF